MGDKLDKRVSTTIAMFFELIEANENATAETWKQARLAIALKFGVDGSRFFESLIEGRRCDR